MNGFLREFSYMTEDEFLTNNIIAHKKYMANDDIDDAFIMKKIDDNLLDDILPFDESTLHIERLKRENEELQLKLIEKGLDIGRTNMEFEQITKFESVSVQKPDVREAGLTVESDRSTVKRLKREIEEAIEQRDSVLRKKGKRIRVSKDESRAYKERRRKRNFFFYHYTNDQEVLGTSEWSREEDALYREKAMYYKMHRGEWKGWGYFSLSFKRKTGKQCKRRYSVLFSDSFRFKRVRGDKCKGIKRRKYL